jgi:hypothetical protein
MNAPGFGGSQEGIGHNVFGGFDVLDAKHITEYRNKLPVLCTKQVWQKGIAVHACR